MSDLLSKIRELRGKATNGPWRVCFHLEIRGADKIVLESFPFEGLSWGSNGQSDAALIVLLVNHLDEIEKALEESDG